MKEIPMMRSNWVRSVAAATLAALVVLPARGGEKKNEDQADVTWMTTIGIVSTAYFYQTHLSIGLLVDAREKGLYPKDKCSQLQQVNSQLLDATKKQLNEMLEKGDLTAKDAMAIKELRKLSELLQKECQAIEAYWKSESDEDLKNYAAARERVSKSLSSLSDK
jgi:hypothetical protein